MNKLIAVSCIIFSLSIGTVGLAQQLEPPTPEHQKTIGSSLYFGGAGTAENLGDTGAGNRQELKARFAGGIGFYIHYYLTSMVALSGGLDFVGKGYRTEYDNNGVKVTDKLYLRHMEFPLGVLINISGLHIGVHLVPGVTLGGKIKMKAESVEAEVKLEGDDWDSIRRFNLCPRISVAYAIPVGPISIVPGLMWEMELINSTKGDLADELGMSTRQVNLLVTAGVEYGL